MLPMALGGADRLPALRHASTHEGWPPPTNAAAQSPGGHVCGLFMPEHPLHGCSFGVVGTVTSLVDL